MNSSVKTIIDLSVPADQAFAAVKHVVAENKHTMTHEDSNTLSVSFTTRKTMFTWELVAEAKVSPTDTGSEVNLTLDTAPGRPKALMDGKKNSKAAHKLADQIRAAAH